MMLAMRRTRAAQGRFADAWNRTDIMRQLLLGMAGAAAIGISALAPQAAQAQDFSVSVTARTVSQFDDDYDYDRPRRHYDDFGYGRRHRAYDDFGYGGFRRPAYGRHFYGRPVGYGRPVFGHGFDRECIVKVSRYFDGHAFVKERKKICR